MIAGRTSRPRQQCSTCNCARDTHMHSRLYCAAGKRDLDLVPTVSAQIHQMVGRTSFRGRSPGYMISCRAIRVSTP